MNKSSTFPGLSSVAISEQNGTVTVPIKSEIKHRTIFSFTCISLACFITALLCVTNSVTFYLVSLKYQSPNHPTQNISAKRGTKFTLAYLNDKIIEYCSVRPPFYKYEFHDSKHSSPMKTGSIIDNGRIDIIVIDRWCKVVVKNVSQKDSGLWELFIDAQDGYSERKYQLYNISIIHESVPLNTRNDKSVNEAGRNIKNEDVLENISTTRTNLSYPKKDNTDVHILKKGIHDLFCPKTWIMLTTHCYKFFHHSNFIERTEASSICQKFGSSLSSIVSAPEQIFISSLATVESPGKKVWIGGKKVENKWKWDEGTNFVYSNWYDNEPDSGQDCLYIHPNKNYAWQDASCETEGKRWAISVFLCKKYIK